MTLSYRHFLWASLFGFLFSFQAMASDLEVDLDEHLLSQQWLPIDTVELEDYYSDRRRIVGWSRFFDVSADVIKITGRVVTFVGAGMTFVSAALPAENSFWWTLASGIVTTAGASLIVIGDKSEAASQSKHNEREQLTKRIRGLEMRRPMIDEDV